jgi:hypothetical protein
MAATAPAEPAMSTSAVAALPHVGASSLASHLVRVRVRVRVRAG